MISMLLYHASWDLVYIFGVDWPFYRSQYAYFWQQSICWNFIMLSGFCLPLRKKPLKRGLTVFLCGALVSAVTLIFMPANLVMFGVLTFMGSAMLLVTGLHKILFPHEGSVNPRILFMLLILSFLIFMFLKPINSGYLLTGIRLPESLYSNLFTAYLGFPAKSFYSTDYFSLLPWIFLFLTGYFWHFLIFPGCRKILEKAPFKVVQFIGKHSLFIYMLHQPLIYLIFSVIFSFRG